MSLGLDETSTTLDPALRRDVPGEARLDPAAAVVAASAEPAPASPFAELGLTYDDVLLQPGETDVVPSDVDTTTRLTREISIRVPLISAAMDTVTEARMAIAMARHGGIGILHRNLSIEDQAYQVDLVKRTQTGMISNPVTIGPDATLEELDEICGRYRVSGLPVVDESDHLLGIVTNRDLRFTPVAEWGDTLVRDVMTPMPLITGHVGISHDEATLLLRQHKRERLPIVDDAGRLRGLITVKDFVKSEQFPDASKTPMAGSSSVPPSATSVRPGSAPRPSSTPASTCSSSTRRTATPACCSRWSSGSRVTPPPVTCRSSGATSPPGRGRRRASTRGSTPSRSAWVRARSAPPGSSRAWGCRR